MILRILSLSVFYCALLFGQILLAGKNDFTTDQFIDAVESIQDAKDNYYVSFKLQARLFLVDKKDKMAKEKIQKLESALKDKTQIGVRIDLSQQKILEILVPTQK